MKGLEKQPQIWKHNDRVRDTVMDAYDGFIDRMRQLRTYQALKKRIPPLKFEEIQAEIEKLQAIGEASYAFDSKDLEYLERYIYFDQTISEGVKEIYSGMDREKYSYRCIVDAEDRYEALRKIRLLVIEDVKKSKLYKIRAEQDDRPINVKGAVEERM